MLFLNDRFKYSQNTFTYRSFYSHLWLKFLLETLPVSQNVSRLFISGVIAPAGFWPRGPKPEEAP